MITWSHPTIATDAKFGDYVLHQGDDIRGRNRVADYFYDFWCGLCVDGHKPTRADIRPANMKQFLNRIVLMDVKKQEESFNLIVRLIGTHVAAFYGELAGKDIHEMENDNAVHRIYTSCANVLTTEEPVLSVTAGISQNKIHLEGSALYMPLFDESGAINKIMVSVDIKSLLD